MRYLITGARGFIGKQLCRRLKERKQWIRALLRDVVVDTSFVFNNYTDFDEIAVFDFNHLPDANLPANLMQGIDTVIHLAGIAHATAAKDQYEKINIEATRQLLALAQQSNVQTFIYFSSIKAAYEDSRADDYGRSKRAAEDLVLEFGKKFNRNVAILRPALVYGPGVKGNLANMIQAIKTGWFPPIPETGNKRSMISVDDVVDACILVAENLSNQNFSNDNLTDHKISNGKIYTLTDGIPYSTRTVYDAMRETLNLKPVKWSVPAWILKSLLSCFSPSLYERLLGSAYFSNEEISRDLDWKPKDNLSRVLPSMIENARERRV